MTTALTLDDYGTDEVIQLLRSRSDARFGYLVTPNVDHLLRYHDDPDFRRLYAEADYVLLDSRFLAHLLRALRRLRVRVCPGSDLTLSLFQQVVRAEDRIVVVGAKPEQIRALKARFELGEVVHIEPPMGFIHQPDAVEDCLRAVEAASPFRFCFLAVGSPQQELVAQALRRRGVAQGMGLCVGASIDFLTGVERRAPAWLQKLGLEWVYRLAQSPRRLAKRYLVRGPRIFTLLSQLQLTLRRAAGAPFS